MTHLGSYFEATWLTVTNFNQFIAKTRLIGFIGSRGGGSGCTGCAIAHLTFRKSAIFISFKRKKKLEMGEKLTKIGTKM